MDYTFSRFPDRLLVLIAFFVVHRVVARLLAGLLHRTHVSPAVESICLRLTKCLILGFGGIMAAGQLGFQVTAVLAGLGIAGLIVGLAAQDSLSNLLAGITIIWDRPFNIGDEVEIADMSGVIKEIGLRSTRLVTEGTEAIVPNTTVIQGKIVNFTRTSGMQLVVPFAAPPEEDLQVLRHTLLAAVAGNPQIDETSEPKMMVVALNRKSVELQLCVWLRDAREKEVVLSELLELVQGALVEEKRARSGRMSSREGSFAVA